MCMMCNGWTRDEVLQQLRAQIGQHGFALQGVQASAGRPPFTYTIGLAAAGHPELVISSWDQSAAWHLLGYWAEDVLAGRRYEPGVLLEVPASEERMRFVRVSNPRRLVLAAEICTGPLTAVQAVRSDERGRFPGDPGWTRTDDDPQELFGRVQRPGVPPRQHRRPPGRPGARRRRR